MNPPYNIEGYDFSLEDSIVWKKGSPADYPYLREIICHRTLPADRIGRRSIVAYAVLKCGKLDSRDLYLRRAWRFRVPDDPYPALWEDRWPWQMGNVPCEGVKPCSIRAGQPSIRGREDAEQWCVGLMANGV